jgi:hypothetical protein
MINIISHSLQSKQDDKWRTATRKTSVELGDRNNLSEDR